MRGAIERDAGLTLAITAAGGMRPLARKVGVRVQSLGGWPRVPRARVFEVARAAGVEPEAVRPDLAGWIKAEREREWMARARSRFGISAEARPAVEIEPGRDGGRPGALTMDLLDLGLIIAAVRFAAAERGLSTDAVLRAPVGGSGGAPTVEQAARSYGASLAVVVGQVGTRVVAGVLGLTRQAVEKAAERYLRARDGDDEDEGERVIERGRIRRAKAADDDLWSAERRFLAQLAGGEA